MLYHGQPASSIVARTVGVVVRHVPRHNPTMLNAAKAPQALNAPAFGLHALKGDMKGHWAVTVNGNWRMTFRFEGADAILVDYQDYH